MKVNYYSIVLRDFNQIDIKNKFFNSFKKRYKEFEQWFSKKIDTDAKGYILYLPFDCIAAFGYCKYECEEIVLLDKVLPAKNRIKIGSLKVDTRIVGYHLYHKILETKVFTMVKEDTDSIYITIFEDCWELIEILKEYDFKNVGTNLRGETVYIKEYSL